MEAEINAAVEWWAKIVAEPPAKDNGDALTSVVADALTPKFAGLDNEQIRRFKDSLSSSCESEVARGFLHSLGCDYYPDHILGRAAEVAGIEASRFPWKTRMYIEPGKVEVSLGYGAPLETIYPQGK